MLSVSNVESSEIYAQIYATSASSHSQTWDLDHSIRRALLLEKKIPPSNLNIGIPQNLEKTEPDVI